MWEVVSRKEAIVSREGTWVRTRMRSRVVGCASAGLESAPRSRVRSRRRSPASVHDGVARTAMAATIQRIGLRRPFPSRGVARCAAFTKAREGGVTWSADRAPEKPTILEAGETLQRAHRSLRAGTVAESGHRRPRDAGLSGESTPTSVATHGAVGTFISIIRVFTVDGTRQRRYPWFPATHAIQRLQIVMATRVGRKSDKRRRVGKRLDWAARSLTAPTTRDLEALIRQGIPTRGATTPARRHRTTKSHHG